MLDEITLLPVFIYRSIVRVVVNVRSEIVYIDPGGCAPLQATIRMGSPQSNNSLNV